MKVADVSDADLRLNKQSLNDDPFWRNCEDSAYVSLMTTGGGDCAIHAAIGSCSERGRIEVSDPRAWIQQTLSHYETAQTCVSALETIVGAAPARDLFAKVTSALGQDLFLPWLRGDTSEESQCLVEAMQQQDPSLVAEGEQFMLHNAVDIDRRSSSKRRVLDLCRDVFQFKYKDKLIQPIALRLGFIPGAFFGPSFLEDAAGKRLVAGTRTEFPADAPESKFEALFDPRPCFDALRWAFMVAADPLSQVSTFHRCLHDRVETLCEEDASVVEVASPLCDELRNYDGCRVVPELPPDFINRVWPCYRVALHSSHYWLSCDELLLLCTLAKIPIAIFAARLAQLDLVASYLPEGAEPVLVKLNDDGRGRQRTHFERVLPFRTFLLLCPRESHPRIFSEETSPQTKWQNLYSFLQNVSGSHLEQWLHGFFASFCDANLPIDNKDVAGFLECLRTHGAVAPWMQDLQTCSGASSVSQELLSTTRAELLLQYLTELCKSAGSDCRSTAPGAAGPDAPGPSDPRMSSEEEESTGASEQESAEESASSNEPAESEAFSDISDDSGLFEVSAKQEKTWTTRQDLELQAIREIAADLRDHPLLPPDPDDPDQDFLLVHDGIKLPAAHCAFRGIGDTKIDGALS